jgi:excisionase family DNA binding protein
MMCYEPSPGESMLTTKELCEKYKISDSTVTRWRREGLPFERLGPRLVRFDEDKVIGWLKQHDKKAETLSLF